jgi:aldehyde dehydrogenase (NAD+)
MITIWKLAPALAAGNVMIIKTPEQAPLFGQKLAKLVLEAGFPPGVISVLCGRGQEAGQALAEHPLVRKISFTGSTQTGRKILKAAAMTNLKKVTLELGGKGPSIVFEDADIDNAVFWTVMGSSANNGQVCALGSRIYVHQQIYDRFLEAFKQQKARPATIGDPLLTTTTKGPVVSRQQHEKILGYIKDGKDAGAHVLIGGNAPCDGLFIEDTIFTDVHEDMALVKEEIFGPVAVSPNVTFSCISFKSRP